jgi:oligopeptide transport system substrate-binding protein
VDEQIFEEARGFLALAETQFIEQRSPALLTRIVISQYFIKKALLKNSSSMPDTRHLICRLLPSLLSSPFSSKKVLGVFIGLNFLHKYDAFTEEHVLKAFQRLRLDVQYVPRSSYSFQRHSEPLRFLYLEVEMKGQNGLSLEAYNRLRGELAEALKKSVERLQPSIFMVGNEEEVIKNALVLSREIHSPSDPYQAMIHFDEQTDKEVSFQIVIAYAGKKDLPAILKNSSSEGVTYFPKWTQVACHLKRQKPVQAHVFKLRVIKSSELLRLDSSLNYYAARQYVVKWLEQTLGTFRDYNGGLLLKQGEILAQYKQQFHMHPAETLENFFYTLTPLEIQAAISLAELAALFTLFLEGQNCNLESSQGYFAKFERKGSQTFCMFQTKDPVLIEQLQRALHPLQIASHALITSQLVIEGRICLGYIYESQEEAKHAVFVQALETCLALWKKTVASVKTLRFAIGSRFHPLDPRIQGNEDTKPILKMLFEGLMHIDVEGNVVMGVAKSVKISKDRKKYTFKLKSTFWSNGEAVTAGDFEYAWKSVLSPQFKAPTAYLLYPIKHARAVKKGHLSAAQLGVKALNKNTLEVELEYPAPYFLELLAQPQFAPINPAIDQSQPTWVHQEGSGYVCNGAFALKKNIPFQCYELVKNPTYHQSSKILLDRVSIKHAQSVDVKEMFRRDEIDWMGFPTQTIDLPSLPLEQGETVVLHNDATYWYVFNTRCFPFNHVKVRQALALVINRGQLLRAISPGYWPAFTCLPFQHSKGYLMEESQKKGVEVFEEALAELGLSRKSFPIVKFLIAEGGARNSIAKIIKEGWERVLGIKCQIDILENWYEAFNRLTEGDFQIGGIHWTSLINDPSYTLQIFHSASQFINFPQWKNDQYDQLIDQANAEKRSTKRLLYLRLAEDMLLKEAPIIPLVRTLPCSLKKSGIELANHSLLKSWDFKWASVRSFKPKE